jgi:uncharacterized protein YceH (UPF0502 family)
MEAPMSEDRFILDPDERRVMGVLIEKSLSTPQYYPMTVNAMVAASNQKSNREPVVQFVDDEVEEILLRLQRRGLVSEHYGAGGRTARWKQEFTKELGLDGQRMAVVAELLLRGPQTVGELRTRASRMKEIPDLDALEAVLVALEGMEPPRLVRLSPPDQKRGVRVTHGFYAPGELDEIREAEDAAGRSIGMRSTATPKPISAARAEPRPASTVVHPAPVAVPPPELQAMRAEIDALRRRVVYLEEQLGITTE